MTTAVNSVQFYYEEADMALAGAAMSLFELTPPNGHLFGSSVVLKRPHDLMLPESPGYLLEHEPKRLRFDSHSLNTKILCETGPQSQRDEHQPMDIDDEDEDDDFHKFDYAGSNNLHTDQQICCGMLLDLKVSTLSEKEMPSLTGEQGSVSDPAAQFRVVEYQSNMYIVKADTPTIPIGVIEVRVQEAFLEARKSIQMLHIEGGGVPDHIFLPHKKKWKAELFEVSVNIYSPKSAADTVGRILGRNGLYLQPPDSLPDGMTYHNPHFYSIQGEVNPLPSLVQPRTSAQSVNLKYDEIFGIETVNRLTDFTLMENETKDILVTELLEHQAQALEFMRRRESGKCAIDDITSMWHLKEFMGGRMYENAVTGQRTTMLPSEQKGGIIADEMGMGKTLTTLSLIASTLEHKNQFRQAETEIDIFTMDENALKQPKGGSLVIATPSLLGGWKEEIEKHIRPNSLKVVVFHGSDRTVDETTLSEADIVITTYNTIGAEWDKRKSEREKYEIMKEQTLKEIDAALKGATCGAVYLKVLQLITKQRILCDIGTNVVAYERVTDEAGQCESFVEGQNADCAECHCDIGVLDANSATLTLCGHWICRDCLPNYTLSIGKGKSRACSICGRKLPAKFRANVPKTQNQKTAQSKKRIMPLLHDITPSSKFQALASQLNSLSGKSLVFSVWTTTLDLLEPILKSNGIRYLRIDGSTRPSNREKIISSFRTDDEVKVLLMTFGVGAVGLNLTVASTAHLLEPQWNPMIEKQAIGRVYRLGQDKRVKVIRYIVKNSIEEDILERQRKKLEVAEMHLEDSSPIESGIAEKLKDLRALF
ncbi:DNA repair protein RAD5A [Drechslerella dactyloides]|uniref:DNA repair protein RAD5A n=1 Tax=Drechslerella dactyloides TaxID=74499 RepID=A0AAD6NHM5_DREDA|nr:DNA repair protein RAD5A [Drechslerella dactyloides]